MAKYTAGNVASAPDGRLFSHVFERNSPPIIAALTPWLMSQRGTMLELGSGTGQHAGACALAFRGLTWQPSDPEPDHRISTAAWRAHLRLPPLPPLDIDAASNWAEMRAVQDLGLLTAVVSMNVIHIAPIEVARGIVAGAGKALDHGGLLIFYGPFKINGAHIGSGNEAFDEGLRAENPDWGLRDVTKIEALGRQAGLGFAALQAMPANNRLLILARP